MSQIEFERDDNDVPRTKESGERADEPRLGRVKMKTGNEARMKINSRCFGITAETIVKRREEAAKEDLVKERELEEERGEDRSRDEGK